MKLHLCLAHLLALGCAVTSPTPIDPLGPEPSPSPAARAAPETPPTPGSREVGAAGVARLCEVLRDEDAMTFEGNEVQRARAREEHRRRRLAADDGSYVADVPATGFAFRRYELAERRLVIDTARSFVLTDGVELVPADPDAPLAFELAPEAADSVLKDHAAGRLRLRLVFRAARSEMRKDGCLRLSGGRIVKLPAHVLAYTLLGPEGAPVARGHTPEFADEAVAAVRVRTPEVTVGRPRTAEGRDVSDAVAAAARQLEALLLPCYQKVLSERPTLRGTLVLDLRLSSDGRVESSRMEMSSGGNDDLVACSVARLEKARLAGGPPRLSLPIRFHAKEDP